MRSRNACGAVIAFLLLVNNRTRTLLSRLNHRINLALEPHLPEQRLFLKSDAETRFIRLRPLTQATGLALGSLVMGWAIFATALILMESISAGTSREQMQRQEALYEARLTALSADRDLRVEEAASAQARFNAAMAQVSLMQAQLLASENRRHELETGIDVIQSTLRRTIVERDEARAAAETAASELASANGGISTEAGRVRETLLTLDFITATLAETARERDLARLSADRAAARVEEVARQKRELEARNDRIFSQLEEALTVSVEPLEKMFNDAGLSPDAMLDAVRAGYSGQGGPLSPIVLSTAGQAPFPEELRANAILEGLDEMNLYRIAAFKVPFAMPVRGAFRWTSGFGYRQDPKGWGTRQHEGTDMAGAYGMPVYATADGVVAYAGWQSGYGRLVRIRHANGIETRYGHLSQIRVETGQRVSRGDQIGDMGNSGRSTGTHLHYEIRIGGEAVNPMTFIKAGKNVF